MRTRLLAIALLVALPVVGVGCGGGGDITKSGDAVPATTSASGSSDAADDGTTGTTPATEAPSGSGDDQSSDDTGDGDSAGSSVEADPAKCVELTSAFARIAASGATVSDDQAQAALDQLVEIFPADLADDLRTLVDAYGDGGASSLSSQEFIDANTALTEYLTAVCGAPR